jgi:ferredoxin
MAIKNVEIMEGCIACGICESTCPEVFEVDAVALVVDGADLHENEEKIKEAAASCPVSVIKIEE